MSTPSLRTWRSSLCIALGSFAGALAGVTPPDPWARVPKLPTACYSSQDQFLEQVTTALQSVTSEIERRETANRIVREQYDESKEQDPFAEAARIQNLLGQDPEQAMQILQQASGAHDDAVSGEHARLLEEWQRSSGDIDRWIAGFEDALSKSRAPLTAKLSAMQADDALHEPCGEMYCWNRQGVEQYNRFVVDWNAIYDRLCNEQWRSPAGLIGRLDRFRQLLATERLPFDVKAESAANASLALLGQGPATEILEIAPWATVRDYLSVVQRAFQHRESAPLAPTAYWNKK